MSWLQKLKEGFTKTTTTITRGISDIVTKTKLDDDTLTALEEYLITTDMGPQVAGDLCGYLRSKRFAKEITADEVRGFLAEHVAEKLEPYAKPIAWSNEPGGTDPDVLIVVGINGAGKTTTIGKLLPYLKKQGRTIRVVAGDTFRAAAVNQLRAWCEKADIPIASGVDGADAAALAYQEIVTAKTTGDNLVVVDTAGRLHTKKNLMEELSKVIAVTRKLVDAKHIHCVMVLDATSGQNVLQQVTTFQEYIPLTGIIMTKLDGTAKGGVLLNVVHTKQLCVHFIGVGESADALQAMSADAFARNLFGLGEVTN
ncbi:MAG: signal recognition particle-docking protein FtsY [Alphaproteobacteria bacterium]|nr:MAG: signal recognition particle-docking protein FtsY [Alphaproteobacteria bacterium]